MKLREFTIAYYESEEAMQPTPEQVAWATDDGRDPNYNFNNIKYATVKSSTLGGAYRAFTMSNDAIVVSVEDTRSYRSVAIVG